MPIFSKRSGGFIDDDGMGREGDVYLLDMLYQRLTENGYKKLMYEPLSEAKVQYKNVHLTRVGQIKYPDQDSGSCSR